MKRNLTSIALLPVAVVLLFSQCKKQEAAPEFEQQDAPYTGQFAFKTQRQQFAQSSDGKNIMRVTIEGTGSFSFVGNVTFVDEFDFALATGAATHKATFTTTSGDKIYTTMATQVGQRNIVGTTTFTGGTGRFAKLKGNSPNTGPLLSATGEGIWKEDGGKVTF